MLHSQDPPPPTQRRKIWTGFRLGHSHEHRRSIRIFSADRSFRDYLSWRLLSTAALILGGATFVFLITHLGGGDPARMILGDAATDDAIRLLHHQMGLDRPVLDQYIHYMVRLLQGDLGNSWYTRQPVIQVIAEALPKTLLLTVCSSIIAWLIGVTIGVVSAYARESPLDLILRLAVLFSISTPGFVLSLLSIFVFALYLGWFPTSGMGTWKHLVLPAVTLGLYTAGLLARMARGSMLDVLSRDFIMAARARGIPEFWVVMRHAFRNALLTVITVLGLQVGVLMGGAVITEVVFAWPGMGRIMVQAIFGADYPTIRGVAIVFLAIFALTNLIVDILYAWVDPRLKLTR